MTAEGPRRGADAALQKLNQISPNPEVVPESVIAEGKDLLSTVARGFGYRVLDVEQMRSVLTEMIGGTAFANARIDYSTSAAANYSDSIPTNDIYRSMYVVVG